MPGVRLTTLSRIERFAAFVAERLGSTRTVAVGQDDPALLDNHIDGAVAWWRSLESDAGLRDWDSLRRCEALCDLLLVTADSDAWSDEGRADPLDRFIDCFHTHGVHPAFAGRTIGEGSDRTMLLAVVENDAIAPPSSAPADFRVVAVTATYNERDIVRTNVNGLLEAGIEVVIVDNWSDDGTYELVAETYGGSPFVRLERFPADGPTGTFDLGPLMRRVEDIGAASGADWVVRNDADEVRESPWSNVGLRDALYTVQVRGFDSVDFTVLEFRPTPADIDADADPVAALRYFEFGAELGHFTQITAWRNRGKPVGLAATAGHSATFEGQRVFPYKFLLRHYPLRSQAQAEKKVFRERQPRWNPQERAMGWHTHYDDLRPGHRFVWDERRLIPFDDRFAEDYLIERLSGVGLELRER